GGRDGTVCVSAQGFAAQATDALENKIRELSVLDFSAVAKTMKIDSLLDPSGFASVRGYKNLNQSMDSTFGLWQTQFKQGNYNQQIAAIQNEVAAIKPDSVKNDLLAMAEMLKKLDNVSKRVAEFKNDIDTKKKVLTASFASIQNDLKQIQNSLQADIEMAKRRAKLQGLEMKDVAMVLFGEPVVARIEQILNYIAIGRKYWPAAEALLASNEPASPPRFEGQNIYFPFHERYPRLLVRKLRLSGMTATGDTSRGYTLEGEIFGLTTEPPVYGQPIRIDLKIFREAGNHYSVRGAFDHIGDTAKDSIWISADNIPLGSQQLMESKYFPSSFHAERGGVDLTGYFIGDTIDLNLGFRASPAKFQYTSNTQDKVAVLIREILDTITQINLDVVVAGKKGDYSLSMRSNIDNDLSTGVMGVLAGNLIEAQAQLEKQVRDAVAGHESETKSRIAHYKQTTLVEVDQVQKRVQSELDKIEKYKKDIEARIDAKRKKAEKIIADEKSKLEEKAKKGLKSLLKKKN
ncbi:MAG: hypothetical protein ACE5I1_13140, partial [bacterium]